MKKIILIGAIAVVALLVAANRLDMKKAHLENFSLPGLLAKEKTISPDAAKAKALDFIQKNLVQDGTKVDVKSIAEESGLYKLSLDVSGQEIVAYMTQDGKTFFPNAMAIEDSKDSQKADNSGQAEAPKDIPKSDKPDVKLFVMSYCPYGTQIEKGILPVIEALGSKIDFELKFVDYAMHDKKELDENLRQYCLQKNEPEKLEAYLTCFLKKGQGTESACLESVGANTAQLTSCVTEADQEFEVTKNFNDKNTWKGNYPPFTANKDENEKYGVQGSPTLVINDTVSQSSRDPQSLLATICSAFNTEPNECQTQLSSDTPSPGFGEGTAAASGSDANCDS